MPPTSLELLIQVTFPPPSSRIKVGVVKDSYPTCFTMCNLDELSVDAFLCKSSLQATERFEAVYSTLKELSLAGSPGTKAIRQVSQQLLPITVKAMTASKFMHYIIDFFIS